MSDGTAAGTTELTINGAQANGLYPQSLTTSGNLLYFAGNDTAENTNLWVSDGTAAGTTEITATGANSSGLSPINLTAFGGKLYFDGRDATQ